MSFLSEDLLVDPVWVSKNSSTSTEELVSPLVVDDKDTGEDNDGDDEGDIIEFTPAGQITRTNST